MSCSSTQRKKIAAMDRNNDGSSNFSSGSGDLSDYEKLREDNIRRNEASFRSFGCDPADYRICLSSSGLGSGDFNNYETIREDNIRRNEIYLSYLVFAPADNRRSSSSSGSGPGDVQRRFCCSNLLYTMRLSINMSSN
jgi:hypothetical protein